MKNLIKLTLLLCSVVLLTAFTSKTDSLEGDLDKTSVISDQLNAAFKAPNGKIYFFSENSYFRYNSVSRKIDNSATIIKSWTGVPNNVNAALVHSNGKGYFFKGSTYYRYDFSTSKIDKTGTIGASGWKGVPNNVDAAVIHPNGRTYFFKGSTYYRYSSSSHKVDKTAPISTNWKGVPDNVDAALLHTNGKIYFFKGNTYYRYSSSSRKVDKVGTVGVDGWKGLSFAEKSKNATASTKDNIRLKVTLTRIKSIQARDGDDIADFSLIQVVDYKTKENQKLAIEKKIKVGDNIINTNDEYSSIIHYDKYLSHIHVREGDENHFINNSLVYDINPQEIADKRAEFKLKTKLEEVTGEGFGLWEKNVGKGIAEYGKNDIEVSIHEVLDYLQNPNSSKYSKSYFNGGKGGNMHEYGAFGDVMWFKKGSNNSLVGHLEFGDNNKDTYVRLYYRFELVE